MKKTTIAEWLIFIVCAATFLITAMYSDRFVPTSFGKETFKSSVIEPRDTMYGAAKVGDRFVWIVGQNGKIVQSVDGGKIWKNLDSGIIRHLQDIAAWDERRLVAVGNDGVVIISRDGGDSWAKVEAPKSKVANKLIRVKTFYGGKAWTCGVMGTALSTNDYGATWVRRIPEQDVAYNDIAFATPDIGVIVCEFGEIKRTEDGGDTWAQVKSPVESSLEAVCFNGGGIGIAVGLGGVILRSADYGKTWTRIQDVETSEHLWDIIYSQNRWICVGSKGVISSSLDKGIDWNVRQLSKNDMLWHTEIVPLSSKLIIVGGTQGVYKNNQWSYLF
ncbi:MAG: WD40/YVTN/BNR-like repeat-containing protein [Dissulfuribacterales bacterium]